MSRATSSFWFVVKAIEIRLRFVLLVVGMALVIGNWSAITSFVERLTRPAVAGVALSADSEFFCPMHPQVIRHELDPDGTVPECPICGMPLSKRKLGAKTAPGAGSLTRVQFSPERVQLAGIRTEVVKQQPLALTLRTVGFVSFDESTLSRTVSRVSGYVEKLYINRSFIQVKQGEPLAEIYSPELYSAATELLLVQSRGPELAALARDKLRLLGVANEEIDEIIKSGKAQYRLLVRAPRSGHLVRKEVMEGDRVEPGRMLFEVADLATVWIEGEVFEKDIAYLSPKQKVEATVEALPGRVFHGAVDLIHPHLEAGSRTIRVRMLVENPGHELLAGMSATVTVQTPVLEIEPFRTRLVENSQAAKLDDKALAARQKLCPVTGLALGEMGAPLRTQLKGLPVLLCCKNCPPELEEKADYFFARAYPISTAGVPAVPERAVIDTGEQKLVYVEREPGVFEGREVKLGPRSGGYYAVVEGVLPGDRVAAAGAFLIDAETRLNPAAAAAYFGASGGPEKKE